MGECKKKYIGAFVDCIHMLITTRCTRRGANMHAAITTKIDEQEVEGEEEPAD